MDKPAAVPFAVGFVYDNKIVLAGSIVSQVNGHFTFQDISLNRIH